eukprot:97994-Prymnesium_polylepis.2
MRSTHAPQGVLHAVGCCTMRLLRNALKRSLVSFILVSFILVTSTSTRIFKAFLRDDFQYDSTAGETRRYLKEDLFTSCDSREYDATYATAQLMVVI